MCWKPAMATIIIFLNGLETIYSDMDIKFVVYKFT